MFARVYFFDLIVAVVHLKIRSQKTHGNSVHIRHVPTGNIGMSNGHLSAQNINHVVEIGSVFYMFDPWLVPAVHFVPRCPVHIIDIEKIPHVAPTFLKDLCIFRLGINFYLGIDGELILWFWGGFGVGDHPTTCIFDQCISSIRRGSHKIDAFRKISGFFFGNIIGMYFKPRGIWNRFGHKNLFFGTWLQQLIVPRRKFQCHYPILNIGKIDHYGL